MTLSIRRVRALTRPALVAGMFLCMGATALAKPKTEPTPATAPGTPARTGTVLVTVNGQPVTQDMLDTALAAMPADVRDQVVSQGLQARLRDHMVLQELLWQEAVKRGLSTEPAVQAALVMAARDVLANAVLEAETGRRSDATAVKAYYDAHPEHFKRPQVHARHILVSEEQAARDALAKVKGGTSFADVARTVSRDPGSAENGGDLGWFERGTMVPEFEAAAFGAATGALVGPVKSQFGWHVLEILGTRDTVPLDEVREGIEEKLRDEARSTWIEELRARATIVPGGPGASSTP
jgi:peptidyl-prolyl cis-trans isomerase C